MSRSQRKLDALVKPIVRGTSIMNALDVMMWSGQVSFTRNFNRYFKLLKGDEFLISTPRIHYYHNERGLVLGTAQLRVLIDVCLTVVGKDVLCSLKWMWRSARRDTPSEAAGQLNGLSVQGFSFISDDMRLEGLGL